MEFMKLAEGSFHKCHMKSPLVKDPLLKSTSKQTHFHYHSVDDNQEIRYINNQQYI